MRAALTDDQIATVPTETFEACYPRVDTPAHSVRVTVDFTPPVKRRRHFAPLEWDERGDAGSAWYFKYAARVYVCDRCSRPFPLAGAIVSRRGDDATVCGRCLHYLDGMLPRAVKDGTPAAEILAAYPGLHRVYGRVQRRRGKAVSR